MNKKETENESIVNVCVCVFWGGFMLYSMELLHAFQFYCNPNVLNPTYFLVVVVVVFVAVGQIQISISITFRGTHYTFTFTLARTKYTVN